MDRLISEQAVIDRLSHWYSDMLEIGKEQEDLVDVIKAIPSAEPTIHEKTLRQVMWERDIAIEQLKELGYGFGEKIPSAEPQTGHWIPVSERLPNYDEYIKNNGLFNVSDENRSYSEWFDIYDKQMFGEPTISGFRVDYAVTAWQPLPEPYEPQERSK